MDNVISEVTVGESTGPALNNFANEPSFRMRVYSALKRAIIEKDIYSSKEPCWIDERQIAEKLGNKSNADP